MVTYTIYVIATLAAVCLTAAWPQYRVPQPNNDSKEDDRLIMSSDESEYLKTIFTYPYSRNTPGNTGTKNTQRRTQRLQGGFYLDQEDTTRQDQLRRSDQSGHVEDIDYTRRQRQHQQHQRTSTLSSVRKDMESWGRVSRMDRVEDTRPNTNTTGGRVNSRAHSSQQPTFQPRAQQAANNQSKPATGRGAAQLGGSGRGNGNSTLREGGQEGRGLPDTRTNGTRDDPVAAASQETALRSRHVDNMAAERNLPRWGSNKGTRVKMPNESIVFPETFRNDHRVFIPPLQGDRPPCADDGDTFCTTPLGNYPVDHLNRILEQQGVVFRSFFTSDDIPEANDIAQRFDDDSLAEQPLCMTQPSVVYPTVGQNKDNEWLFIVNLDEQYKQGVRVEKCRTPDEPCAFNEGFPNGRQTKCKQKYIYRHMLALTQDGTPKSDSFKLPSCCVCHISITDVVSRSGFDPSKQTPAPKRRKRR